MNKILFYLTFICITLLGIKTYANTINISPVEEIKKDSNTSLASLFLIRYSGPYNLDLLNRKEFALNFSINEPRTTRDLEISYNFEDTSFGSIKNNNGTTLSAPEKIYPGDHSIILTPNKIGSSALIITLTDALTGDSQTRVIKTISRQTNFFLKGQDMVYLKLGDGFTDEGFTAIDAIVGDVTDQVIIDDSSLDTNTPGEYIITYELNINGSILFLNRVVNVSNIDAPIEDLDFGNEYLSYYDTSPYGITYIDIPFDVYPINASDQGIEVTGTSFNGDIISNIDININALNSRNNKRSGNLSFTVFNTDNYSITITTPSGIVKNLEISVNIDSDPIVNSITFNIQKTQIKIGEIVDFTVTTDPAGEESSITNFRYSGKNIVDFNFNTKTITGIKPGKTVYELSSGFQVSNSIEIEVLDEIDPEAVTSITPSSNVVDVYVNRSVNLTATVEPSMAANKNVNWVSYSGNISIDDTGKTTGLRPGIAKVFVRSESHPHIFSEITVNVSYITLESISATPNSANIKAGDVLDINTAFLPVDSNPGGYEWSSDNTSVATVNNAGQIEAIAEGAAKINVSSKFFPDIKTQVSINVVKKPEFINVIPSSGRLNIGESLVITPEAFPADSFAGGYDWVSSNPAIASVNSSGRINANAAGKVTVFVASKFFPDVETQIPITVLGKKPEFINVIPSTANLNVGDFIVITPESFPADSNSGGYHWVSDNPATASVNSSGRINANAAGNTFIFVSSKDFPDIKTRIPVTVMPALINVKPTSVKIAPVNSADRLIPYGGSLQLNASVFPDNATNKKIIWRSRDEKTAKVNANGLVTPVRQSEVGIIAFSEEDNTIRDEIKVRVYAFPSVLENIDGDFYSKPNETISINVTGQSQYGFGGKVIVETSVDRFNSVKDTKTFNYLGGQAISGSFTYKLPANGFSTFRARIVPNAAQHNDNAQIKITGGSKTHTKNLSSTGKTAFP